MKQFIIAVLILTPFLAQSQEKKETRKERNARMNEQVKKMQKDAEEGAIIFNKQSVFSIALRSDGYSIGFEKGKFRKINKINMWWVHLGERKHPKEEKLVSSDLQGFQVGNPYIYGKKNNFYLLNVGFGQQRLLGGRSYKNGVAVSAIYGGGLTLGMLKPYYVEVDNASGTDREYIKYDDDPDKFLDATQIYGAAPFGKGFNEITYVPGAFVKGALRFEYGRFNDVVAGLELGVTAEYYTKKMPIMLLNKEKTFFVTSYISLLFGSRK